MDCAKPSLNPATVIIYSHSNTDIKQAPPNYRNSRQRGRMGKGVVFTTTLIEWSGFNPHPGHVVASLDKTLNDNYLSLVASNKQQIQWTRIRRNPQEHWIIGNSSAGADSSNHEVVDE